MINRILYESKDYIIVYKPSGLPTVPLKTKAGGTLLDSVAIDYPEIKLVNGKNYWEGGVIHRLDTPTSGLVLFARTQTSYDWAINEQNNDRIIKRYIATYSNVRNIDAGFEKFPYGDDILTSGGVIRSGFRAYGEGSKAVRPVFNNPRYYDLREYTTYISPYDEDKVICSLKRGFRHQVRSHLAWARHPLVSDILYGAPETDDPFGLEAVEIEFTSITGEHIKVSTAQN